MYNYKFIPAKLFLCLKSIINPARCNISAEKESGVVSVLENSLHHVSKKDELSFSIDMVMTEDVNFYQKLVMDLGLRPVNAAQVPGKR